MYSKGLAVYDVRDPARPACVAVREMGVSDFTLHDSAVAVAGGQVYTAGVIGLGVFDAPDPASWPVEDPPEGGCCMIL